MGFFSHCVNWAGKDQGQEEKGATEDERLNDITDSMDMSFLLFFFLKPPSSILYIFCSSKCSSVIVGGAVANL